MRIASRFQRSIVLKITSTTFLGILTALILIAFFISIGFRNLRRDTLSIIRTEIKSLSDEYYENFIDEVAVNIEGHMNTIFSEIHILSGISQIYFSHREEFSQLSEQLNKLEYFTDTLNKTEFWIENQKNEPTEIFVPRYLLDNDLNMKEGVSSLVDDTRFLDLILPVFASSGVEKIQAYYQGGKNREIFRLSPWFGIGENIYSVYPEMNELPIWETFNPGLAEQWESLIRESKGNVNILNSLMRVTPPVQDGLTGEIVLTISQPIAGNDYTTFEGTISYDIPIDSIINFIEQIQLFETGFAFLTQSNGNIFGINEYGLGVFGLTGAENSTVDEGVGFNNLKRFFENSIYDEVKNVKLNSTEEPAIKTLEIQGKEYIMILKKLKGYQSWNQKEGFFQEHWNLGFLLSKDEVFKALTVTNNKINEEINTLSINSMLIYLLFTFLLLGVLYLLINRITKRLNLLVHAADEIKNKNYNVELDLRSDDEVGQLGDAFNSMIKEVKSSFSFLSNEIEQRKKSEEKYLTLMESVPDPIVVYDINGEVSYLNPAFSSTFGWSLEDLQADKTLFIPEGMGEDQRYTKRLNKEGDILDVSISQSEHFDNDGKIIGTVLNIRDVTKWKRTQEIMIQSEKMISFSNLAANMAHDIKNPLAGIVQNAQVISNRILGENKKNIDVADKYGLSRENMNRYMADRGIPKMIDAIIESVKNANTSIDHILSFNVSRETKALPVKLVDILNNAVSLGDYNLKHMTDSNKIGLIRDYQDDLPPVICDKSKILQVFFNILKNSIEAFHNSTISHPEIKLTLKSRGDHQIVEIFDNGPGMDEATISRVFEPFFKSKNKGSGKGLGLSVAYFIVVENHKGTITVESKEGEWTKFTISLPC